VISDIIKTARAAALLERKRLISSSGVGSQFTFLNYVRGVNQQGSNGQPVVSDPYDGNLTYIQQGGATTVIPNPVGAYNLTALMPKVTEIHCHNCPLITGLICTADALLTVLDLEDLPAIVNLNFNNCTALTSVNLDTFTSLSGICSFHTCTSLSSFSAANLVSTGGRMDLILTAVVNQSFPSLVSTGGYFGCSGTSLLTVNTPVLVSVGDSYYVANSPSLTSVSAPNLVTLATGIYANNCPSLAGLNFNSLVATSLLEMTGCTALTTLSFPSLVSVDTIIADGCTLLDTVDFTSLDLLITGVSFNSCTSLPSIGFPAYSNLLPFAIFASDCTLLSSFSFATMIAQDGSSIGITNCALNQATVDSFIQALTDGANTVSVLDLSAGANSPPDAAHALQVIALNAIGNLVVTN